MKEENTGIAFIQNVRSLNTDVQCVCDKTGKCHCMISVQYQHQKLIFIQ